MSHQIEVKDVAGGFKIVDLAASHGNGDNKKLQVELNINLEGVIYWEYVVLDKRVAVYRSQNIAQAVHVYNNL